MLFGPSLTGFDWPKMAFQLPRTVTALAARHFPNPISKGDYIIMKASKHRTLKKVLLNIMAVLCVVVYTGSTIAAANAGEVHKFFKTSPTKIVMKEGAEDEGYKRYYESVYASVE